MIRAYRHLGAPLAAIALMALAGPAGAASKAKTVNLCEQAIKQEFGESPVKFDKFRRDDSRNFAFGELTMSDGSKARVRCQMRGGKILNLQFRGDDTPGRTWVNQRPPAAIFVEPKDEDDAKTKADAKSEDAKKTEDDKAPNTAARKTTAGADATKAGAGGDDATVKDRTKRGSDADKDAADKDAAEKDTAEKDADTDKTADAKSEDGPVKPRFIKVPTQ